MKEVERVTRASTDTGSDAPRDSWHPRLRRLHQYWLDVHPPEGLPRRQHFDPIDVPELLPNLWLLDVQREPFRLRYRLAGTRVVLAGRREVTGQWLDDARPQVKAIPGYFDRFRAVVETKMPSRRRGVSDFKLDQAVSLRENLFLPLAGDELNVDMILGITIYFRNDMTEL
jgi:hypothetical protein